MDSTTVPIYEFHKPGLAACARLRGQASCKKALLGAQGASVKTAENAETDLTESSQKKHQNCWDVRCFLESPKAGGA